MDALESLINTVQGSTFDDTKRIAVVKAAANDLENSEAVAIVAREEADKLRNKPDPTPEEVQRALALVDVITALAPSAPDTPEGIEDTVDNTDDILDDVPSEPNQEPVSLSAMRRDTPRKPTAENNGARFVAFAAADVPDMDAGARYESASQMGSSIAHRMRALTGSRGKTSAGLITYKANPHPDAPKVTSSMSPLEVDALFSDVANPNRLTRGSDGTFANAGFCSPSMIDYSFCPLPGTDGIVDLPSITIERGGIRYPATTPIEDLWGSGGACYTEAEAMALEDPKPCYDLPCPEFQEVRENICHVCVTNSILTEYAYPELVTDVVNRLLAIFEHRLNAKYLEAMEAASTAVTIPADRTGPKGAATAGVLNGINRAAEHLRYANRRPMNEILEAVLPIWARGVMKEDLAKRNGIDLLAITDADLMRYFAARNIRLQFVYDWQEAFSAGDPTQFGGSTNLGPLTWPGEVKALIYPAGTFLRSRAEVIRINGQYDHDLLVQNKALALFAETAWAIVPRCFGSLVATIPVCDNGVTGSQELIDCAASD